MRLRWALHRLVYGKRGMHTKIWRGKFRLEYREGEDDYYDSGSRKLEWTETMFIGRLWC